MAAPSALPCYRLSPEALIQRIGEETVFLQLASEGYYLLDDVGSHMLSVLLERQDRERAIAQLTGEYGVDPIQVHDDFMRIIDCLITAGLLVEE